MKNANVPAIYATAVGTLMIAMWVVFLASGQVPELKSGSVEIVLHLAAECTTALILIVGGAGVLSGRARFVPLLMVGHGMLLYTLIVSPGYYADRGEFAFVVMFGVLFVTTVGMLVSLIRRNSQ